MPLKQTALLGCRYSTYIKIESQGALDLKAKYVLPNPDNTTTDLQWAMMGPASGGLQVFTLRRKARKGVGYSGTPWSGHAVNWN